MNTSRPVTVTSAIVLLTGLGLVDLTIVLIPPQHLSLLSVFIYAWSIVFGVVGLIGAFCYGLVLVLLALPDTRQAYAAAQA